MVRSTWEAHVKIGSDTLEKIPNAEREVKERVLDLVDQDGTLREIKNITEPIEENPKLKSQLEDYLGLVGKEIDVIETNIKAKKVVYSFVNPAGGAANISDFWDRILRVETLSIEVVSSNGTLHRINRDVIEDLNEVGWNPESISLYLSTGKPSWPLEKI